MSLTPQIYSLRRHGKVLGTRSLGARIAAELRESNPQAPALIVDFRDIRVASSPVLDEISITLRAMIADHPGRYVLLANLNEDLLDTLELVVERRGIVLTAVKEGKLETVGGTQQLGETLAAAEELGTFTAPELAERLEIKLPNLHQRLNQLEAAGALTRADDRSAKRGRRLLFATPESEQRTPAAVS
jgi:DNA-binding MarR family transcriptional regulator